MSKISFFSDTNFSSCPNFTHETFNFKRKKWAFYFLEQEEIDFLETVARKKSIPQIADYAKVEIGITN